MLSPPLYGVDQNKIAFRPRSPPVENEAAGLVVETELMLTASGSLVRCVGDDGTGELRASRGLREGRECSRAFAGAEACLREVLLLYLVA